MVTSRSLRDWRELNIEVDAHCFHKVSCGSNVRVDELGGDDATSGVADTVWWDFDGQELEGQGPDTPCEACVFTSVLPFSIHASTPRALSGLTSNTIRRGVERFNRERGDLVVRHRSRYDIHDSRSRRVYWARKRREGVLKDVVGSRSRTTGMSYGEKMDVGALLGRRCKADVRPVPERIRP